MGRNCANVAAALHAHLCECPKHGYSWEQRYGYDGDDCAVEVDGEVFYLKAGDYDCSSSTITCWQKALEGTLYEGVLDGATYTGNMASVFCGSGLFETYGIDDFCAQRGDLYLNVSNHVAMCQDGSPDNDILSEFSSNEFGGCYGGEPGDQTGWESHIQWYYSFPWDVIVHYNGKADGEAYSPSPSSSSTSSPSISVDQPRYRAYTKEDGWLDWMEGTTCTGGSGDDYAGISGNWIYDVQFENLGHNGWYRIVRADDSETINESGNTESPVVGIEVYYDTDMSKTGGAFYYKAKYQVHWLGSDPDWGQWEYDDENNGAGKDNASPLDMIRLYLEQA